MLYSSFAKVPLKEALAYVSYDLLVDVFAHVFHGYRAREILEPDNAIANHMVFVRRHFIEGTEQACN
jgi:hypothetical protein